MEVSPVFNSVFQMAETGLATWTTLAMRLPVLVSLMTTPTDMDRIEAQRMVDEKVTAALEGLSAAQTSLVTLSIAMMRGEICSVNAYQRAMTELVAVAMAPAQRKVRANARRLTGLK
jgi:Mlc titration factor MtfA (ptsG expression regulator)